MHIPESLLNGALCPITGALSGIAVLSVGVLAFRATPKHSVKEFGGITAVLLVAQMLNFPIFAGTSGHLLGGVLASSLLGVPLGVLSLSLVISIQALLFSDGGITALGANILNMALLGAGLGGMLYFRLRTTFGNLFALAIASWISVMLAAQFVSLELAFSTSMNLFTISYAMLGWHSLIGIAEAIITVALFHGLTSDMRFSLSPLVYASLIIGILCIPFASKSPDGLERVMQDYSISTVNQTSDPS